MNTRSFVRGVIALVLGATTVPALAIDLVHRRSADRPVGGEVTKISRTGVTVLQQVGNKEQEVPANDISSIEWDSEPGPVKLARGGESTGNFDEAIRQYEEAIKATAASKEGLKIDVQFGLARVTARKAVRTGQDLQAARDLVKAFLVTGGESYRFFDAQLLAGELALLADDLPAAETAYSAVVASPWADFQMSGKLGLARTSLKKGDVPKARQLYDEVAGVTAKAPSEESRRLEAILGQAMCLKSQSDVEGASKLVEKVIEVATPADSRVQGEAYLRQGELLQSEGKSNRAAIRAYLHLDVIPEFSAERDLHAEALYHLALLWPTAGEAERGADAANRLKTLYPNTEWARKLSQ